MTASLCWQLLSQTQPCLCMLHACSCLLEIKHTHTSFISISRVLSAHRQRENNHSELTREGGGVCEGSTGEVKGEAVHSFQLEEELPLLTQRQLEATFISTADFLVR